MLTQLTVRDYAARLASGDPTPGGGSAAALVGALAAALGEMVANFTRDKAGWEQIAPALDPEKAIRVAGQRVVAEVTAGSAVRERQALPAQRDKKSGLPNVCLHARRKAQHALPQRYKRLRNGRQ